MSVICVTPVLHQKLDSAEGKIITEVKTVFTLYSHVPTEGEVINIVNKRAIELVKENYPDWDTFSAQTHIVPEAMLEQWIKENVDNA